jgi:hypothetical protein
MANGHDGAVMLKPASGADVNGQCASAPRRLPSFLRLSVRGLLVLILVIGCGLAWIARALRTAQTQRSAVAAIYQAGGWVVYDTEWDGRQNHSTWKPRWPRWLIDRLGVDYFSNAVFANLHDRGSDRVLTHVGRLKDLKQLHRPGPAVTDAGLAHLERLSDLQLLSLDDTQVTDAGLAHLKSLKSLKWLKIARTRVTDAGVADLQKAVPRLRAIR